MLRSAFRRGSLPLALGASVSLVTASAQAPESPLDSAQRRASASPAASVSDLETGALTARLSAIRAAPFGADPEATLPKLVEFAAGRDPTLAPAAAVAVHRIAEALSRPELEAHEADFAALERARTALSALAKDESARSDIRRLATLAASELGAVTSR